MRSRDCGRSHIVASAALAAVIETRRRSVEGLSGQRLSAAPELLRGHAAGMRASPVGRDQILGLALRAAADELERGGSPEARSMNALVDGLDAAKEDRLEVRREVFRLGALPVAEALRVVDDLERRFRPECATLRQLSRRLAEAARLHELLWDDPRLSCDDRTRAIMLASVPKLLERADQLDARASSAEGQAPRPQSPPAVRRWALRLGGAWREALRRRAPGGRSAIWAFGIGVAALATGGLVVDA